MGCCSSAAQDVSSVAVAPERCDTPDSRVLMGRIIRVVDGDTYEVDVVGKGPTMVRLLHVQAPETRLTDGVSAEEKQMGIRLREHMAGIVKTKNVRLMVGPRELDKYKRLLASISVEYAHSYVDIGDYLLSCKLAKKYEVGKPPHFSAEDVLAAQFMNFDDYAVRILRGA